MRSLFPVLFLLTLSLSVSARAGPPAEAQVSEYFELLESSATTPGLAESVRSEAKKHLLKAIKNALSGPPESVGRIIRGNLEKFSEAYAKNPGRTLSYDPVAMADEFPSEVQRWMIAATDRQIRFEGMGKFADSAAFSFEKHNAKLAEFADRMRSSLLKIAFEENVKLHGHYLAFEGSQVAKNYVLWGYLSGSRIAAEPYFENQGWRKWFEKNFDRARILVLETYLAGNPRTQALFADQVFGLTRTSGDSVERARLLKNFYDDRKSFKGWFGQKFSLEALAASTDQEINGWGALLVSHFTEAPGFQTCGALFLN